MACGVKNLDKINTTILIRPVKRPMRNVATPRPLMNELPLAKFSIFEIGGTKLISSDESRYVVAFLTAANLF